MPRRNAGGVPGWVPAVSLALAVIGLALSAYLTYEHYSSSTTLSCPDTGAINCLKVTTSSYSSIIGIPVALLGLLYYVAITVLCLPPVWKIRDRGVPIVRLAASAVGMAFVLYLVWVELYRVDAICLWCTGVHVVTLLLFIVIWYGSALAAAPPRPTRHD